MALGSLSRAYAYEVSQRQAEDFRGGAVRSSASLISTLESTFRQSGLDQATSVDFNIDTADGTARSNPVRSALISIGFGNATQARKSGAGLAARLGAAMDHRSKPALLLISVHEVSGRPGHRQLILWTFPQQEVFRLRSQGSGAAIDVLDVFSRESKLRKAAMFAGGKGSTDLLTGRALDFQASATDRAVADLWIVKVLDARLQMSSDEGTRLLARSLRHAHDRLKGDPHAQAEIQAAIVQLRNTRASRITLGQVASPFSDPVAAAFRAPQFNDDAMTAAFPLNKALFDKMVEYTIYELDNGVWVSAPFGALGKGVTEEATPDGKRVTATGIVESERVRARHG